MINQLEQATWDSDFFDYKIGRIHAGNMNSEILRMQIAQANAEGYKLIYLFADPEDVLSNTSAKDFGAKLVDQKVTFRIKVEDAVDAGINEHIKDYETGYPSEKLIDLSLQSGLYSRYKIDENFRNREFERLYLAWIENSMNKKIADHTFVYVEDGKELGVVTVKIKPELAQIGIIAVDESTRGKSIGSKLMKQVIAVVKKKQVPLLDVATQIDNTNACNFYKKLGFHANVLENVYHIWL